MRLYTSRYNRLRCLIAERIKTKTEDSLKKADGWHIHLSLDQQCMNADENLFNEIEWFINRFLKLKKKLPDKINIPTHRINFIFFFNWRMNMDEKNIFSWFSMNIIIILQWNI